MTTPPPRPPTFRQLPVPPRLAAAGVVAVRVRSDVDQWAVDTVACLYARTGRGVVINLRDAADVTPRFVGLVVGMVSDQQAEPWTQWTDERGIFRYSEVYRRGYLRATKELQAAEHVDRSWDGLLVLATDVIDAR